MGMQSDHQWAVIGSQGFTTFKFRGQAEAAFKREMAVAAKMRESYEAEHGEPIHYGQPLYPRNVILLARIVTWSDPETGYYRDTDCVDWEEDRPSVVRRWWGRITEAIRGRP